MPRKRDAAANQLLEYSAEHLGADESITTSYGTPVPEKDASLTVGYHGPILLQDWYLIDEIAHFTRERIPERVVHAKGAGAFGYFEVTHDITQYTAASVFSEIKKKTPIAVRMQMMFLNGLATIFPIGRKSRIEPMLAIDEFSNEPRTFVNVAGELGYPDTVRDVRGFAIKFYTEDGIWDLVGNNAPVFFVKDCAVFPSFIHIMKRNPKTHLRPDYDMFWDMITLRPETTHTCLIFFSDRGIPDSYRHMHGFGTNTYGFVNAEGKFVYCKFHYMSNQGVTNLPPKEAQRIAGVDPDYHTRDLYNAIEKGDYPSWNFFVQIMTLEQAANSPYDPFDDTKVWLHDDYPLIPVGRFILNKNPKNYFAEIEQIGFDPAHLIPGIEPSPDRMLQGRLFAYGDTHRYRLGVNHIQLPVNKPFGVHNFERDGEGTVNSQGGAPNYHPNSFNGPKADRRAKSLTPVLNLSGVAKRIDSGNDDNFTQPRLLYKKVMKPDERERMIENIVEWLIPTTSVLQERAISMFAKVDEELGRKIRTGLNAYFPQHVDL